MVFTCEKRPEIGIILRPKPGQWSSQDQSKTFLEDSLPTKIPPFLLRKLLPWWIIDDGSGHIEMGSKMIRSLVHPISAMLQHESLTLGRDWFCSTFSIPVATLIWSVKLHGIHGYGHACHDENRWGSSRILIICILTPLNGLMTIAMGKFVILIMAQELRPSISTTRSPPGPKWHDVDHVFRRCETWSEHRAEPWHDQKCC